MTAALELLEKVHDRTGADVRDGPERSLPAWTYRDPRFFELERDRLFQCAWQLVCHVNDVPEPGDYCTFEFLNESVVVLRGDDGQVRAFHNVCRHRASRLAEGQGNCGRRLVCPYHAWSYGLDGRLRAVPRWQGFGDLELDSYGLVPVEQEIWSGFVFVRFAPGSPSVASMMAPYADELAPHRLDELVPLGRVTLRPRNVNWKNVADNYGDSLHIPVAHPGLARIFGGTYAVEAAPWVDKMSGRLTREQAGGWSERGYRALLQNFDHLSPEERETWSYYRLWPNVAFDVYADQVDFMQFIPVSPTQTLIREIAYCRPDARREARCARYLNWRINRQVNAEDTKLIADVQAGMASSSYTSGPLSSQEPCLAAFARRLRQAIPEAHLERAP